MYQINNKTISAQGGSALGGKNILLVTRPICPPWDEASKNFAYYLAKNIKDFEIHLLTNGIISGLPANIHQESIYSSANFGFLQKFRLMKYLRKTRNDLDIIHYLFTPTKQNSCLIKNFARPKKAKTLQTIATLREDLFSDRDLKSMLFADWIITYSDYSKNKLENLGFKNVTRIYPGIDLDLYSPASKDSELIKKFRFNPGDFVVVYPGEFTRLGGPDKLLKIILRHTNILKEKRIKFILACRVKNNADKRKKEEIIKIIRENNLEDYVLLSETFTTMEKVYNLTDIVAFPVENMKGKFDIPLVVVEAMACEKPVIISDLPILQEFANSENSVKIETGNMEKLLEKILDARENNLKYLEIGKNARRYAEENFDIKKTSQKYQEVYQNL